MMKTLRCIAWLTMLFSNFEFNDASCNVETISIGLPTKSFNNSYTHDIYKRAVEKRKVSIVTIQTKVKVPMTIIIGETFYLTVIINNPSIMPADVKVNISGVESNFTTLNQVVQTANVPASNKRELHFHLSAKNVGNLNIPLHVTINEKPGKANIKMDVLPEGHPVFNNKPVLIDFHGELGEKTRKRRSDNEFEFNVDLEVPKDAVGGSNTIMFTCTGDAMGILLKKLDKLIVMPTGCGEQTMITMVPVIVVHRYLEFIEQLTTDFEKKAINAMKSGYINELKFRRTDGSFSVWGKPDPHGSTWLTALVLKSFVQAMDYIDIDKDVIEKAMAFLAKVKQPDGSFKEFGKVAHTEMTGNSNKGVALTAYTVIALLEVMFRKTAISKRQAEVDIFMEFEIKYEEPLLSAIMYLEKSFSNKTDIYTLAIVAYALNRAESDKADEVFQFISAKFSREGDKKFWMVVPQQHGVCKDCNYATHALNIEATAYVLMTYVVRGLQQEAQPIYKWLLSKRNANGGFTSTQDTCIGLEAIADYAKYIPNKKDITLRVAFDDENPSLFFDINEKNTMESQTVMVPANAKKVRIFGQGMGSALAQVSWNYFTLDKNSPPSTEFLLTVVPKTLGSGKFSLDVCVSYIGSNPGGSNMAIVEVHIPSGYSGDQTSFPTTATNPKIRQVELQNKGNILQVYFDVITKAKECFNIRASQDVKVFNFKQNFVLVYDYYEPNKRHQVFYRVP